jgi:rubredoxin
MSSREKVDWKELQKQFEKQQNTEDIQAMLEKDRLERIAAAKQKRELKEDEEAKAIKDRLAKAEMEQQEAHTRARREEEEEFRYDLPRHKVIIEEIKLLNEELTKPVYMRQNKKTDSQLKEEIKALSGEYMNLAKPMGSRGLSVEEVIYKGGSFDIKLDGNGKYTLTNTDQLWKMELNKEGIPSKVYLRIPSRFSSEGQLISFDITLADFHKPEKSIEIAKPIEGAKPKPKQEYEPMLDTAIPKDIECPKCKQTTKVFDISKNFKCLHCGAELSIVREEPKESTLAKKVRGIFEKD